MASGGGIHALAGGRGLRAGGRTEGLSEAEVRCAHCSGNDGYEKDYNLMIELIDAVSLHSSLLNTKGAWTQRGLWIHSLHHLILATAIASMQLEA